MNTKVKNIYYTLGANILTFLMGIISGFVIPKFLGIDDFGYVKLFTFYVTYIGITHFGFLDGLYIKYGSFDYDEIPKKKFRGYFKFLIITQILEAILFFVILKTLNLDSNRTYILVFVVINMVICNITTLFAFIHQFTKRFKIFSINLVLSKLMYVVGSIILICLSMLEYRGFVILQTIINFVILLIYLGKNKELVFGESEKIFSNLKSYFLIMRSGFFIMIGNFMGVFILGIDRIFIDKFFTLKEFSMYSFAYTLISLFFILLNSITTVIYPYLSRMNMDNAKEIYENVRISLSCIMSITLIGYFGIKIIVINVLPEYIDSLMILTFLVPTVIYSAQINILISNYYKVLKQAKAYTKNNIFAMLIGVITNIIAFIIFKTPISIAVATLISFIVWVLYSDIYFKQKIGVKYSKAMLFEIFVISVFLFTSIIENVFIAGFLYMAIILLVIIKYCITDLKIAWRCIKK